MASADIRKGLFVLILASSPVLPAAQAQPAAQAPRTIRVVMDNDYPPYVFQSDGKLQGILIDQWRAWETKTGIKAEIHAMDWDQAMRRMRAGEFDVIDCVVQTKERQKYLDFAPAYATVEASIFFHHDISGITDLATLKGFPVGVKAGDQHIDAVMANGVTMVMTFRGYDEIVQAAKQRKIEVFVADAPSALYLLNKAGLARRFRRSAPVFRDELRRAVHKGDARTLRLVSDGFAAIKPGELKQIDEKWFGRTIDGYSTFAVFAGYTAAAALLIIAGLFGWNSALRKRIQQRTAALSESEQRFRQIAENIREVFWLIRVDFSQMLYISPAYETVWGRSLDSLYQDPGSFFAAIHPEDRARVTEAVIKDREQAFEVEYRVVRPDGSIRWIWDRGFPIRDDAARVYRRAGIAEDITERKFAAQAMQQAEDRIRLVIDSMPTMVWSLRPDGALDFVNQRWLEYVGVSFEEAMAAPNNIVHPDDLPRVLERWLLDMAAGGPSEDEMRLRRADGEYRWFLIRTVPMRDEQGSIVKWYGTSTDIEDRRRTEEKLRQSESQLAEAQRTAHVGSWEVDLRNASVTCSDELYRIFGISVGEPDFYDQALSLIHPEDRDCTQNTFQHSVEQKEPFDLYYRALVHGGERILHSIARVVSAEDGTPPRLLGTTQDVTELKRAEEKLKATSEQLRALSARLHSAREEERIRIAREIHDELGATLTSLRWELEGIKKTLVEPEKALPAADLKEKLAAMLELTDAMINIVRKIASDLRPVVLDVLGLEEAIEWQARQFQVRTDIEVHCEAAGEGVALDAEQSTAIFRIFQEALTNVLRHARATRVDVTMIGDADAFVLLIRDNGRGIAEKERAGELSIGLLGMHERAHLIGGEIDVTGSEGQGTTVTLRVPLVTQHAG